MTVPDVAVVGAGAFGAWTALCLRRAGASVLLVDAWGPGHARSSSGGETRLLRAGYGAEEIYTRMAERSRRQWLDLFDQTRQPLFHRTGVLHMARQGDPYSLATLDTLSRCGVAWEQLSHGELARRYPQMRSADPRTFGILEPEAGVAMARRAVEAVVREAVRIGVVYEQRAVASPREMAAGAVVFACGCWLPKLFPELLGGRIFPTRQEVFFFTPPAGCRDFSPESLPAWIDFTDPRLPYGAPDIESRGFKIALHRRGAALDPDAGDRVVSAEGLAEVRALVAERFPALAEAPLAESRVCQYENTASEDFLIDRHPQDERVWIAGGGSGHGFKHGPAVGEHLAARILHSAPPEPRFALRRLPAATV